MAVVSARPTFCIRILTSRPVITENLDTRDPNNVSYRKFHVFATCQARKPRWLPLAKSKMYKVPEPILLPREEYEELVHQQDCYTTIMNSLMELQKLKGLAEEKSLDIATKSMDEEILEVFAKNEAINKEIAKRRDGARQAEWSKIEEEILKEKERRENFKLEQQMARERFIKSEIERLQTAIKMEDLDEAISKAMGNITDYNFAVDLKANYYKGRTTTTPTDKIVIE